MKNIKFLSFILAFVFVFSVFPFNTVYAVENTENAANTQETQEFTLPDIVDTTEATERGYVGRVKDEEKDNYTFVFQNSDNTRTMRVYSHPVKYTDKDGNTKDITLDIQSRTGGGFETKDNSIKTTFGKRLSDGIRLQYEEVDVKLFPANSPNLATLSADSKTVSYVLDEKTTLEYSLTYTGFKEDIVVSEYTGQTEYTFLLYTNGLTVKEEMGSHYLADSEGNRKANIGDIIIFTADERNNTLGELTYTEVKPNQIYLLTIHIDAEYLADEDTVYPIRIDPTLEVTDSASAPIEDVTVYTGTSYYSGTSGILYIGANDSKVYRALMRFPSLEMPSIQAAQLVSAVVELRDVMCQSTQVPIECHRYNAIPGMWWESGTTTWNSVGGDAYVGDLLSQQTVYYGNGNVSGDSQRYAFDILDEVETWIAGTRHPGMGLIFKTSDAFEDEAATSTADRLKYFGSYNRSDYKPSLTVSYSDSTVTTTIAMNRTEVRGIKDGYVHLSAIVTPSSSNPIYWSSSDTSVATVTDTGVVHLKTLGIVTITARTLDNYNNVITAQCVVHCCIPDGIYYLKNSSSDLYADIKNRTMGAGTLIVQNQLSEYKTQKWSIAYNISGRYYTIVSHNDDTTNYYMGVTGDLTSNHVTISLRTGTLTNGMKWNISESSNGNYIFTAKTGEDGNRVLKLYNNSTSSGTVLEQFGYTNDNDLSDEWNLVELNDYTLMFLGAYAGDPQMPPVLSSVMQALTNIGCSGNAYTALTLDDLITELTTSKVFACITHGAQNLIQTSNNVFTSSLIKSYGDDVFSDLEFVYFGACETGAGHGTNNLVYAMKNNGGSGTVLGFDNKVRTTETYYWTQQFMLYLAFGDTVAEAMQAADEDLLYNFDFNGASVTTSAEHRYILGPTSIAPFD